MAHLSSVMMTPALPYVQGEGLRTDCRGSGRFTRIAYTWSGPEDRQALKIGHPDIFLPTNTHTATLSLTSTHTHALMCKMAHIHAILQNHFITADIFIFASKIITLSYPLDVLLVLSNKRILKFNQMLTSLSCCGLLSCLHYRYSVFSLPALENNSFYTMLKTYQGRLSKTCHTNRTASRELKTQEGPSPMTSQC